MSLLIVLLIAHLPGGSSIVASASRNSLLGGSFMEINADMNSTSTEPA